MWGYAGVAILAAAFSDVIVGKYEMMGAAVLYTVLMGVLCTAFAGIFVYGIMKNKKS